MTLMVIVKQHIDGFSSTDKNSWTMLGIGDVYIPRSIDKNKHIRMRSDYIDLDGLKSKFIASPSLLIYQLIEEPQDILLMVYQHQVSY